MIAAATRSTTANEPTYETDEPNGKGCGRVDHVIEETIVIDVGH
jgi:hypothetical protein